MLMYANEVETKKKWNYRNYNCMYINNTLVLRTYIVWKQIYHKAPGFFMGFLVNITTSNIIL